MTAKPDDRAPIVPSDFDDDWDNEDCWNCGGEGYVASCFEEFACMHPDEGCDLCIRRCDVCNPPKRSEP